jgi:signal transduction histidine kinase
LVKTADSFEDTEGRLSFGAETDHNEISHLSMSLNRMLKRLAEDKEQMATQILSLEQANEELKDAREVVLRSEKLSSLGRLAAGVAHEVGNPIGSILGYTDLLMARIENDAEATDYLVRIESEISRINTIVRELVDFSRSSPGEPAPVEVNALVSDAVSFFSHQKLMASVELQAHLEEDVGMVWADGAQLKQVLINLLLNACDAFEDTGCISVHSRRRANPQPGKHGPDPQQGETIEICVSDTGTGIAASELDKIFDPFYTTKPPGKGTGLGLAISFRIVESFGGTLNVESKEGKGSTFTIRLNPWKPNHDTR